MKRSGLTKKNTPKDSYTSSHAQKSFVGLKSWGSNIELAYVGIIGILFMKTYSQQFLHQSFAKFKVLKHLRSPLLEGASSSTIYASI